MASRRVLRKIMVLMGGLVLFVIGIIGLVLPVMPGLIFIVAGLLLMATEFDWAARASEKARKRFNDLRQDNPWGRRSADEISPPEPAEH